VRLLLDTHVMIWLLGNEPELSDDLVESIADPWTDVSVSAASIWEASIKSSLGKLELDGDLVAACRDAGFDPLPIDLEHASLAGRLPRHHADPVDRMLVAQAQIEDLTLVTRDPALTAYDIPILAA
jgi:PIN domain nuclease of toxin-antitoxin system